MTCAKCNHGFCWRCLKPWKPTHKDYYNCSAMVSIALHCNTAVMVLRYHGTTVLRYHGTTVPRYYGKLALTSAVLSSLQVSKAARQEKKFQDYNERCTFHNQAKVRSH